MSDDPVRTVVETSTGALAFQDYFVRLKCEPAVTDLTFDGAERANLTPEVRACLARDDLAAIVICPSNPLISIDPILAVPGMRHALAEAAAPVIAVSPIIAGRAVKGPTAKMMAELGIDVTAAAVARRYADLIDAFVAEPEDAKALADDAGGYAVHAAKTLMTSLEDPRRVGRRRARHRRSRWQWRTTGAAGRCGMSEFWIIVPVKDTRYSKQRLADRLTPEQRRKLALTMLEDVLDAVAPVQDEACLVLVTIDPDVIKLARGIGADTTANGAHDGHTGAVTAAARALAEAGGEGFLTVPGDIPLATTDEVRRILAVHRGQAQPAFTIAPSHDERGSNAIACSPADAVPLQFGDDSFLPHLATARSRGIAPEVLKLAGISEDIDTPQDIERVSSIAGIETTRTYTLLREFSDAGLVSTESSR